MQQQTPPRSRQRHRASNRVDLSPGMLTTALSVGAVLVLLAGTFVADWLRTPEITLFASSAVLSPNRDGDRDSTTLTYQLSDDATVTAQVLSSRGGLVRTLMLDQPQSAGQHTLTWDGLTELGQPVEDGQYRLQISARGTLRASTQNLTLLVDTQPPGLQAVNLPNGLRVRENALTIEGVTEPRATLLVTGEPQPIAVDEQGHFSFVYRLAEGNNTLEMRAADSAGNTTVLRREISLVTTPPEVIIVSPVADSWLNQTVTTVSGVVSPGVSLTINDQPVTVGADGSFHHQLILEAGDNLIRATATDDVGNANLSEILVHVDTGAPPISLNVGEGETFREPVLQLAGSTQPGATVRVNGQVIPVSPSGNFELGLQLNQGANIVDIEVRDQAGNLTTVTRQVNYAPGPTTNAFDRLARNLNVLPSLTIPALLLGGLLVAFLLFRQHGISLSLSVDQPVFTPGLPGEGKLMLIWLDLTRTTRVSLEVLDKNGYPLATILRDRRRPARRHTFAWDGYDDFGRPVPPGEYTLQAEAGVQPIQVTTSLPVIVGEDILVHRRAQQKRVVVSGERN